MKKKSQNSLELAEEWAKFFGECGVDYTKTDVVKAAAEIQRLIRLEKDKLFKDLEEIANIFGKMKLMQENSKEIQKAKKNAIKGAIDILKWRQGK